MINTIINEKKEKNITIFDKKYNVDESNKTNEKLNLSEDLLTLNNIKYENTFLKEKIFTSNIIGQIFKLYILLENIKNNQLILIDIHALHEKIIYTQLKSLKEIPSFELQDPILLQFSKKEFILINENISFLNSNNFEIIEFGPISYQIKKVPLYLKSTIEDTIFIREIIIEICRDKIKNIDIFNNRIIDEYFKKISCKSAIKSGYNCTNKQIYELINQAIQIKDPYTCPHGRPTIITIDKSFFDSSFKRK